jgi:hypothetical protein
MFFPAADTIAFSEGGVESMRLNSSGVLVTTNDASISGLTVGKGAGAGGTNTTFGSNALASNSGDTSCTALGFFTLNANTSGSYNTAVGRNVLISNTTGGNNTAIGMQTLNSNTTASNNTAVGYQAGYSNTTGASFDAFGYQAGYSNTTGTQNSFIGRQSGYLNTSGSENAALGAASLSTNTTGGNNTSIGRSSLASNTTGSFNTAIGSNALIFNTTASNNTAVGYQAGYSQTTSATGGVNTFIGAAAGYSSTGTTNTFVGQASGYSVSSGSGNAFLGRDSGYFVTTGSNNTILGGFTGNQGGLDIRTASNYIVLSDGAGNPRFQINASGNIFAPNVYLTVSTAVSGAVFGSDDVGFLTLSQSGQKRIIPRKPNDPSAASDNLIDLGDAGSRYRVIFAGTGTINTSDANEKQQVRDLNVAEKAVATRIKGLIKAYKFNDAVAIKGDNARIHIGVIAQEVADAFEAEGLDAYKYSMFCSDTWYEVDGNTIDDQNKFVTKDTPNAVAKTRLGIRYDELLAFVISTL